MLLRIAALGALGYAAYKYLLPAVDRARDRSPAAPDISDIRLAGGPLSDQARLQSDPSAPVPADA